MMGTDDGGAASTGAEYGDTGGTGAPGTGAPGTGAPGTGAPGTGAPGTGAPDTGSTGEVQLENENFRVTKWTIEPGGAIPMHRHEHEYVVVPLVTDTMHVRNSDGTELTAELEAGVTYTRPAGSEHEVSSSDSDDAVVFIEVERL